MAWDVWHSLVAFAQQFPRDDRDLALAAAAVTTLSALLGWVRAARRRAQLRRELDIRTREFAALRSKYEGELKWRTAAERYRARTSGSPDNEAGANKAGDLANAPDAVSRGAGAPAGGGLGAGDGPVALGASVARDRRAVLLTWTLFAGVFAAAVFAVASNTSVGVAAFWGKLVSAGLAVLMVSTPLLIVGLYFCPSLLAAYRRHARRNLIFAFNLLLGWTGLGWGVALAWSLGGVRSAEP